VPRGRPTPVSATGRERLCHGPSHERPTWVPSWNFNIVNGRRWYECRDCHAHRRRTVAPYSHVSFHRIEFAVTELIHRLGKSEAARRIGISKQQISHYANHSPRWVRRETALKILAALAQVRAEDLVRHKDSIHNGAYLRGRSEKKPTAKKHLYRRDGDEQNWKRTKLRRVKEGVKTPRTDWS
jgi:hypothetical protein